MFIHCQISKIQLFKFENGLVILSHTFLGMWFFIHAGIKADVSKRGAGNKWG